MAEGGIFGGAVASLGFGGAMGVAAGFATRKLGKLALLAAGLLFLAVQFLSWKGWVRVDWLSLQSAVEAAWTDAAGRTLAERAWEIASRDLPFGAAFAGGFAIGLKLG